MCSLKLLKSSPTFENVVLHSIWMLGRYRYTWLEDLSHHQLIELQLTCSPFQTVMHSRNYLNNIMCRNLWQKLTSTLLLYILLPVVSSWIRCLFASKKSQWWINNILLSYQNNYSLQHQSGRLKYMTNQGYPVYVCMYVCTDIKILFHGQQL